VFDYLVLSSADRLARVFSPATVEVLEKVLGILLAALAVELMLNGLADALGIGT
jgi:small neutral amino acid transporter SnatA (MarC family)